MKRSLALRALLFVFLAVTPSFADVQDPFDPFDLGETSELGEDQDKDKTPEDLTQDAQILFDDERPLDGRTKLLKALERDPKYYQAHLMLAGYYIRYVGHFRLALKYVKQAEAIFEEINGKPPYESPLTRAHHAHILYLLSQTRLNLDNYQGALQVLDQYASYDYFQDWYPGTRSWVLMKLGRVDEAIKVARLGILAGAEPGRTLNMLGILLSMTDKRQESLEVFDQAIRYEMSLGALGQPATPLNNSGEVFKETFAEDRAEAAWRKATGMSDGCEHVLPALNLALLYIEQLNYQGATKAIDGFESCVAQFPLRNGEEHRALVHLARGRIALHNGKVEDAVKHLEGAIDRRQWFGKIGTSEEDLHAATLISLAQALGRRNNQLKFRLSNGVVDWLEITRESSVNAIRAWWLMRRARQVLAEDLSGFEDLYVRHTDSMIEYPTLGQVVAGFPRSVIEKKLINEERADRRELAKIYYEAYRAEVEMAHWSSHRQGLDRAERTLQKLRPVTDDLLAVHLRLLLLSDLSPGNSGYQKLASEIFAAARAELRNYGFRLPVNLAPGAAAVESYLTAGPFLPDSSVKLAYSIDYSLDGKEHVFTFESSSGGMRGVKVKGEDLIETLNKFSDTVFSNR